MGTYRSTKTDGCQRSGLLTTRRGTIETPFFMPVGTRGAVKGLEPRVVKQTGAQMILGNTYHLHLQPGEKIVKKLGGVHGFMNWSGPILTDSGGFQVFSLAHARKITEEGVTFKDPLTGDKVFLSPEKSMQIQIDLGADIIMAFDDVVGLDEQSRKRTKEAFERTHRWLDRSIAEFKRLTANMAKQRAAQEDAGRGDGEQANEAYKRYGEREAEPATKSSASSKSRVGSPETKQALAMSRPLLFGIAQGGLDKTLRKKSLELVQATDVDGIAIGGLSVGESLPEMHSMLEHLAPLYDNNRPHYLMGVGEPVNMRFAIEHGIDMFDCVLPTRNARHGTVWVSGDKKVHLTNARFIGDKGPIDKDCDCHTCISGYSRGFLRHQFKVGETLAGSLASIHNLRYLERLCEGYRSEP
jgi:queuine tRNA-ribosyltransferase